MLNDKDIASVVGKLAHRVDRWYCASLPGPRGTSGQELADMVNKVVAGTDATPAMEENSREVRRIEARAPASQGRPSVRAQAVVTVEEASVSVSWFDNPVQDFTEARKQASDHDRIQIGRAHV